MLRGSVICLIIALIAALLGFGGLAADFAWIGKVLFGLFLLVFFVTFVLGLVAGKKIKGP